MKIQSDFGHLCQTELVCKDGFCQTHKNWFGECSGWDFVLKSINEKLFNTKTISN